MKKILSFVMLLAILGIYAPSSVVASDNDDSYEYSHDSYEDDADDDIYEDDEEVNTIEPDDCDDTDTSRYPGEVSSDGVDNDCDGQVDENDEYTPIDTRANYNNTRSNRSTISAPDYDYDDRKKHNEKYRDAIYEMHIDLKKTTQENRMKAKEHREMFREEHKNMFQEIQSTLSEEDIEALEELYEDMKEEMEELREDLGDAESPEERAELMAEMKELAETHHQKLIAILDDNQAAFDLLEARKKVYEQNEMLRMENREIRKEYVGAKRELVQKYRKAFMTRLQGQLDNIPAEKMQQIADRIDSMIEKYESNEDISDAKKESMLSALVALKEIIEEKMEGDNIEKEILDTVEDLLY